MSIFDTWHIDKTWTLFLDRDGVINHEKPNAYITAVENFKFIEGALAAIASFSNLFGRIVIVTNQQGIGKGLMSEADFEEITVFMLQEIAKAGGRIDKVYHSPYLAALKHEMQKPRNGMAHKAKADFSEIDFRKSVMIGNSDRDMVFGKSLGMKLIFVGVENTLADQKFDSLENIII